MPGAGLASLYQYTMMLASIAVTLLRWWRVGRGWRRRVQSHSQCLLLIRSVAWPLF